ncbi:Hypothetical protein HVR_LOCUS735 [uncultured virus]|nr:Hypothetical protein HVR_LOCUS735 [uncultured virus]
MGFYQVIFAPKGVCSLYLSDESNILCEWRLKKGQIIPSYREHGSLIGSCEKYSGSSTILPDNGTFCDHIYTQNGQYYNWTLYIRMTMDKVVIKEWNRNSDNKTREWAFERETKYI